MPERGQPARHQAAFVYMDSGPARVVTSACMTSEDGTAARVARRLAAILAIDMVGFSRLMEADEAGTIARQRAHRREHIEPVLREHGGRIVKTTGDGLLVEFGSVVDAVDSAVRIQRAIAEVEAAVPKERRIQYRAGINLGDIVIDGDDILGDGVNIAARLESLAEPGGISITASVFEQVVGKLDLVFDDTGLRQVKNIQKPLRVYRVRLEMVRDEDEPAARSAGGLAGKPGIAVLPFQDMSESRDHEYFADGIAEDIITGLSRYEDAAEWARKALHVYADFPTALRLLAASHAALGRIDEARDALQPLFRIVPDASIMRTRAGVPWKRPEDMDRYLDALRKAGMPE
jgi:adenylate cyclase